MYFNQLKFISGIKVAIKNVYDMFYFNVTLDYHYNLTMQQSKTYEEVKRDINDEIESRLRPLYEAFAWANSFVFAMFVWTLVK